MILSSQNMIIDWWTILCGVSRVHVSHKYFWLFVSKQVKPFKFYWYFVILDTGPRHWLLSDTRWYWMESAKSKVNNNLESQYWYRRGGGEDRRLTTECKGWNLVKSIIHFQFSNNCYWSGPGSTFYGRAETDSEREEPMKGPTSVKQLHSPTVLIDAIKNENFPPRNSYNAV